jgi:hypothetical protein
VPKKPARAIGALSLLELHDKQVVWSKQLADDLNRYLRSRGLNNTKDGSWLVQPRR